MDLESVGGPVTRRPHVNERNGINRGALLVVEKLEKTMTWRYYISRETIWIWLESHFTE
jgi:hypothetical protein